MCMHIHIYIYIDRYLDVCGRTYVEKCIEIEIDIDILAKYGALLTLAL